MAPATTSRRGRAAAAAASVTDALAEQTKKTELALRKPGGRDDVVAKVEGAVESAAATARGDALREPGGDRGALTAARQRSHGASRLPPGVQFPLVVVLSLSMASLGYSLLSDRTDGELASVSRSLDDWAELATVAGWRVVELALAWYGGYDSLDVAALSVLSHGPSLYLLSAFYNISTTAALSALAIDTLSALIPIQLLRPLSAAHSGSLAVPNREILADIPIQAETTLLGAVIYGVVLVSSFRTFLPQYLVLYFQGIATLKPAYEASYLSLVPIALTAGYAARSFIFTPFAATPDTTAEDAKLGDFDPVTSSLQETVTHNLWGYRSKTKVAIRRTVALVAVTGIHTYLQSTLTLRGVESSGAFAYAAVWATAALATGTAFGLVGGV